MSVRKKRRRGIGKRDSEGRGREGENGKENEEIKENEIKDKRSKNTHKLRKRTK